MSKGNNQSLAIACASGSFKGAFAHGVLSALEAAGVRADAYAAASSSVIPTAWATLGKAIELGVNYWLAGLQVLKQPNVGMSQYLEELHISVQINNCLNQKHQNISLLRVR